MSSYILTRTKGGSAVVIGGAAASGKVEGRLLGCAVSMVGISGRGSIDPMTNGSATVKGSAIGTATVPMIMTGDGSALGPMTAKGSQSKEAGLVHYLDVQPEEPQHFTWLVPVVGIDYTIETSTNLKWSIT